MKINDLYGKCKKLSIIDSVNILKFNKKTISKKSLIAILTIVTSISFCACNKNDIGMNNYSLNNVTEAQQVLEDNNIDYYNYETGEYVSNSVDDYKKIKDLSDENLIGYYELLGKNESEKVVKALGYASWDDYLIKNNYVDDYGNPDLYGWRETILESNYYGERNNTK